MSLDKQIEFLLKIHPMLEKDEFKRQAVEIRPVAREKGIYQHSLHLWRLDIEGISRLQEFMSEVLPQKFCVYYSTYTYDYDNTSTRINNDNGVATAILPIDLDFSHSSKEQAEKEIKIIKALGIKPIVIFSGHGYQVLILLKNYISDKTLLKRFTSLLLEKGLSVDPKIKDSARILRMPYTFNNKDDEKIWTEIIEDSDERYDIDEIFKKFDLIKSVLKPSEVVRDTEPLPKAGKGQKRASSKSEIAFNSSSSIFPNINYEILPVPIKNMLNHTKEGFRNSVLYFLVPFFRNNVGLSKEVLIKTMQTWGFNCTPKLEPEFVSSEVDRLWNYHYKGFGEYTQELTKEFGYINFKEYSLEQKMLIPNAVFYKFDKLHESSVKIYFILKLEEKIKNSAEWTIEEITKITNLSYRTVTKYLKQLEEYKLLYRKSRQAYDDKDKLYFKKTYNKAYGFTLLENSLIESIYFSSRNALKDSEAKLYLYIRYMLYNNNNQKLTASQEYLGEKIGKSQNRVSELTDLLEAAHYIKKDCYFDKGEYIEHCIYTLNY